MNDNQFFNKIVHAWEEAMMQKIPVNYQNPFSKWNKLVDEVTEGYLGVYEEYDQDLGYRDHIEYILRVAKDPVLIKEIKTRLSILDNKFKAITIEVPFVVGLGNDHDVWWRKRLPRKLPAHIIEDFQYHHGKNILDWSNVISM